jgi:hypothetical protein
MARAGSLGRSPFGEAYDAVTPVREQIKELVAGWRREFGEHEIALNFGALHINQPTLGTSSNPLEISVSWKHRL